MSEFPSTTHFENINHPENTAPIVTSSPLVSTMFTRHDQPHTNIPETNICNDIECENDLIAAMSQLSSESDIQLEKLSVADAYIGHLQDAWSSASYTDDIIDVRPQNLSRARDSLLLGSNSSHTRYQSEHYTLRENSTINTPIGYDDISDDETNLLNDLNEKADAVYNKICSIEQTDADLVEGFTHVNDYLDSLSKDIIKLKIDMSRRDMELCTVINNMQNQVNISVAATTELNEKIDRVLNLLINNPVARN